MNRNVSRGLFYFCAPWVLAAAFSACRQAGSDSAVVARVGGETITMDELKGRLQDAPPAYQQYVASPEGRRQFLNLLIREKILLAEAKRLGISRDPSYKMALDKYKADARRRLKDYEETLQVESALRRLRTTDLAATDTDVEKYYTDHRAEFDKPVEIIASHILVSTEQEAQTALLRLKDGESFDKVARDMSKDPATAVRGGKLAPFQKGTLVPEFEDAAFALRNGEVSGIVKTQFGFHIIKKLGEKPLPPRPFAELKDEIRQKLERDKFNQWVMAKQALAGINIDEQAMARLTLEESTKP